MGSLNAPGIPVPGKTPVSIRKMDIRITKTDAKNDVVETVTDNRPELARPLGSGCVVRDAAGGAVADCTETVVWGLHMGGTSSSARIASDINAPRDLGVDNNGNMTQAVIETSLMPDVPQISVRSFGSHIDRRDSVTDENIDTVKSEGPFDPLTH